MFSLFLRNIFSERPYFISKPCNEDRETLLKSPCYVSVF